MDIPTPKFEIKQIVQLVESGETGTIIAAAQYLNAEDQFLIRYRAGDGRQVEQWWVASAMQPFQGSRPMYDPTPNN